MKKFLSWLLCATILFNNCSSAFALDLFKNVSEEKKVIYYESLDKFKRAYEIFCGVENFDNDFASNDNNMVFVSTNIENPDYDDYDYNLAEARKKVAEKYNIQEEDVPLVPVFILSGGESIDAGILFEHNNDQSITLSLWDDFNVNNLQNKIDEVIHILREKDIPHKLSVNYPDYKNAPEDEQKAYSECLENLKNYYKDTTGRNLEDDFDYSEDSTIFISKYTTPDLECIFNEISEAKRAAMSELGLESKKLIPIFINPTNSDDERCVFGDDAVVFSSKYRCISVYPVYFVCGDPDDLVEKLSEFYRTT